MPPRSSRLYCVLVSSSSACHQLFFFAFSPSRVHSSSSSSSSMTTVEIDLGSSGDGTAAVAPPISADALIGIAALAMALVTLLTVGRMLTRWVLPKQRGWDDWAMVVAWLATIPLCALQVVMARHGAGGPAGEVSAGDLAALSRAYVWAQAAGRVAGFAAKSSVLLLHMRAFYPPTVRRRGALWRAMVAAVALNALYTVAFAAALAALRERAPWAPLLAAAAAANLLSDAVALAVPVVALRRLRITRVRRTYVVAVLIAVGALAPLAGMARLAYQLVVAASMGNGTDGDDVAVTYAVFAALATIDQIVAVFVGCAPMIIPMWAHAPLSSTSATQQSTELALLSGKQQQRRRARDPYSSILGDNDDEEMWWPQSSSSSSSSSSRDVGVVEEVVSPALRTGREEGEYVFKPLEPVFLCYDSGREHKLFVLFLPPLPLDSFEGKGCI
ncbi:hypothetical protein F4775DRAFT_599790 [Biscogniauxia sp. FL1348]|nr:hypothetical protein F4775DRAFT_599790 [Biscogniauxia sp. FL1348]